MRPWPEVNRSLGELVQLVRKAGEAGCDAWRPNPTTSSNVRTWCVLCHASALLGLFFHFLGHILGPLAVWLLKRMQIDAHGKESLNFQISMLIYDAIPAILASS